MIVKNRYNKDIDIYGVYVEAIRDSDSDIRYFVIGKKHVAHGSDIIKTFKDVTEALDYADEIVNQLEDESLDIPFASGCEEPEEVVGVYG